ncbi:MAG: four helix bundle protein [Nitrospirae bacterium]|nr:four helix bundle protein [Nitrospirota bacterium]
MKSFKDLKVWEKAHEVALTVYKTTQAFPKDELYGLTSQLRRAASSVPANIAEGCGRKGDADMARFIQMAMGSASELEYHLLLARDLKFISMTDYERLESEVIDVKKMLASFIQKLRADR